MPALFIGFIAFPLFKTAPPDTLVGEKMPEFSLEMLGTDERLTSADLAGKAVVVNFWASCGACPGKGPRSHAAGT